jgi:hypothetical protein
VLVAIVFCVAIPVLAMASLVPSLQASAPKVLNYRGNQVFNGLGVVWFIWLVAFWIGAHILNLLHIGQPGWISYLLPTFPLLAGACVFGLFDDWAGSGATPGSVRVRGFRGHLKAMLKGRITTGGLKFLGIGMLSLFTAVSLYYDGATSILKVVLVTSIIALFANLLNLFDLRPARASKVYLLGLALALCCVGALRVVNLDAADIVALALAAFGPVLATWRFDAGEKGMLGDAGANAAGALLGYLMATALPFGGLVAAALLLLALNLASEKWSFSQAIEGNKALKALDQLGRKR